MSSMESTKLIFSVGLIIIGAWHTIQCTIIVTVQIGNKLMSVRLDLMLELISPFNPSLHVPIFFFSLCETVKGMYNLQQTVYRTRTHF